MVVYARVAQFVLGLRHIGLNRACLAPRHLVRELRDHRKQEHPHQRLIDAWGRKWEQPVEHGEELVFVFADKRR